jgi:hypothetical protein
LFRTFPLTTGEFHDQGEAIWIVIRRQLRGHKDTPFREPTNSQPIGCPVVGSPQGVIGGFSYYLLVILSFNIVPLIIEFTYGFFLECRGPWMKQCEK